MLLLLLLPLVLLLAAWEELVTEDDEDGEGCCNSVGSMVRQGTRYVRVPCDGLR